MIDIKISEEKLLLLLSALRAYSQILALLGIQKTSKEARLLWEELVKFHDPKK